MAYGRMRRVGGRFAAFAGAVLLLGSLPAGAHALSFTGPYNTTLGSAPQSVSVGNFNGDSDLDLAVVNEFSNNVSVLLGSTGGGFTGPTNFTVGTRPLAAGMGDFNGDSDPDLAIVNESNNNVSVLVGAAGGSFTGPTNFAVGTTPQSVGVGLFNADADPDLAVVNEATNNVSILLGGAGASFSAPTNFPVNVTPRAVVVGDFNGDSDPDLAVANELSNDVSILLGAAGGSFTGPTNFAVGSAPTALATGEFNGDSDPDLAVANELSNSISILQGAAAGTFTAPTNVPVGSLPDAVEVGEFSGDSDPDLAVANQGSDSVSLLVGGAGAAFGAPIDFAAGDGPSAIGVGDFDGDALSDLAVGNEISNNLSILLAAIADGYVRPKGATPVLTALVPSSLACPNAVVTVPNRVHAVGNPDSSCNPPTQASPYLTVGTPDANGAAANMIGSMRLDVCPVVGCAAPNVLIEAKVADVRCQTGATPCGAANAAGGADYAGEVEGLLKLRITDRLNGPWLPDAATGDVEFPFTVACTPTTADTARGSDCNLATSANAVVAGAFASGKRSVVELDQLVVRDGGSDGDADTKPDNVRFAVQGILLP